VEEVSHKASTWIGKTLRKIKRFFVGSNNKTSTGRGGNTRNSYNEDDLEIQYGGFFFGKKRKKPQVLYQGDVLFPIRATS